MTRTVSQALAYLRRERNTGAKFPAGMCKQETREAYLIPSDGSDDATEAWSRTRHRLTKSDPWTPGAFAWWTGGSEGHGHVAICDTTPGYVWSVDALRAGHWDRVLLASISAQWSQLREAGFSADIEGVKVVNVKALPASRITQAHTKYTRDRIVDLRLLDAAVAAGRTGPVKKARDAVDAAMRDLFEDVTR